MGRRFLRRSGQQVQELGEVLLRLAAARVHGVHGHGRHAHRERQADEEAVGQHAVAVVTPRHALGIVAA